MRVQISNQFGEGAFHFNYHHVMGWANVVVYFPSHAFC